MKWLGRYLAESSPTLKNFAKVVASLAGSDIASLWLTA